MINGITDGTKDLNISALTCAGTATFNGNVTLGNASTDTVTFTAEIDGGVLIDGSSDEVQFTVQGHSSQSNALVLVEKSDGTDIFRVMETYTRSHLKHDFAAGTAAEPSIGWFDDDDGSGTGLYRSGANEIGFSNNGTASGKWNSSGILICNSGIQVDDAGGQSTLNNYIAGTTWTANLSASANLTGTGAASKQSYTRIGNLVMFQMRVTGFSQTAAAPTRTLFAFDLPIASSTNGDPINGTAIVYNATEDFGLVVRNASSTTQAFVAWRATTMTGAVTIDVSGSYYVL